MQLLRYVDTVETTPQNSHRHHWPLHGAYRQLAETVMVWFGIRHIGYLPWIYIVELPLLQLI